MTKRLIVILALLAAAGCTTFGTTEAPMIDPLPLDAATEHIEVYSEVSPAFQ